MKPALDELAARVIDLTTAAPTSSRRIMIGLIGCPGGGKTTLANLLVDHLNAQLKASPGDRLKAGLEAPPGAGLEAPPGAGPASGRPDPVAYVPMDGFHLADVELERIGRRDRKGAPDTFDAYGYVALLRRLRENTDPIVYVPGFDRALEQPIAGSLPVFQQTRVIITEGNYLLLDGHWSGVRPLLDETWFCRPDEDVRMQRLLARHIRFGKTPEFARTWIEQTDQPNAETISATQSRADLLVDVD